MVRDNLVTKTQAQALKELGFKELTSCYFWTEDNTGIMSGVPDNSNNIKHCVSVPTTDEAIDWLRRKYNIVRSHRLVTPQV